ncbi:hypothetical protein ATANTOWER_014522 [Ataeniobius toweri]|uniref:Selenoprotein O n=1 Tax=Ataeniobius toweri TaxID=208326 RepID=A0ABU7B751_9TELE|nr:hypothetical protein [Ataeniobius toweri]
MFVLGIPTTRAASIVTSDLYVTRYPLNSGERISECCSVVMRLASSFIRFGSFEIFLGQDEFSGLQCPSAGRHDIRAQLLDYVVENFYPHIQETHNNRKERNLSFFREVRNSCFLLPGWLIFMASFLICSLPGDDADCKVGGAVAVRWLLPRCAQHRQYEHPGSNSGLWPLWFHGQVLWT